MFHHSFLLCILSFIAYSSSSSYADMIENKVLTIGEELWKETLPLQMGSRFYLLHGLKSDSWYEVKISYPASIPASFSIQLKKDHSESKKLRNRRILNTEKLVFKTDNFTGDQDTLYVLVTVEPEGLVAIPDVPERPFIMFNIVCDELLLGIPHKACWVGVLALVCLVLAFMVPRFLPSYLLQTNGNGNISKES